MMTKNRMLNIMIVGLIGGLLLSPIGARAADDDGDESYRGRSEDYRDSSKDDSPDFDDIKDEPPATEDANAYRQTEEGAPSSDYRDTPTESAPADVTPNEAESSAQESISDYRQE